MHARTTARTVGLLFITATAAGVASVGLLEPANTAEVGTVIDPDRTALGALMILIMAAAIAMIPPVLYPVLKRQSEALALGYLVSRTLEVVLLLPGAIVPLIVAGTASTSPDAMEVLRSYSWWGHPVSSIFFCLSVAILNTLLFRGRLVPRVISAWALLAVVPYLVDGGLVLFGQLTTTSTAHWLLVVPLAVNEMVLALWLLIRGFRTPAVSAGQADASRQAADSAARVPSGS